MAILLRLLGTLLIIAGVIAALILVVDARKPYNDALMAIYTLRIALGVIILFFSLAQGALLIAVGSIYDAVVVKKQQQGNVGKML